MIDQRIFTVAEMPLYQAVVSVTEDGKVWVKYYHNNHEVMDGMDNEDYLFAKSVLPKFEKWVSDNKYTLWSY